MEGSVRNMNYHTYMRSRMLEISYLRARMQKLFAVFSDRDYYPLQDLLVQAQNVLKRYL